MLKKYTEDVDTAFIDISKTLFWQGYRIWKARKELNKNFWKEIAPQEWKLHNTKKRRKSKLADIKAGETCKNPFHYLKKHADLSNSRPTPCPCSRKTYHDERQHSPDIRSFFPTLSILPNTLPISGVAREELIRGAHDRGKKYKHDNI